MAKIRKVFFCNNCGFESAAWTGKCHACGQWNSFVEEILTKSNPNQSSQLLNKDNRNKPTNILEVASTESLRYQTHNQELNKVLGGGIVNASLILIGGEPGIGKSTLLLQMAIRASRRILYASAEESEAQIKLRANRIGIENKNCFLYSESDISKIISSAKLLQAELIIIDSIQTINCSWIESPTGSVSQIRECTNHLQRFAKENDIPIFIVGHITKDGALAGPKVMEHMMDVVLQFEGDRNYSYRILRSLKNRFGSTEEIGVFGMESNGLKEISHTSELLISHTDEKLSGSVIAASIEGGRPMFCEVQALVSPAIFGNPQRSSTGFDLRRLAMMLAILEKRCGFALSNQDVFLNIAGGFKVTDTSIDLAIIAAIISSFQNTHIPRNMIFSGEVGLSGEVRPISRIEQRIQESDRLGYKTIYISKSHYNKIKETSLDINIQFVSKVDDLISLLFMQ